MLIEYQGIVARSVIFRRRRGYAADVTELLIPVQDFPGAFDWQLPSSPGDVGARGGAVSGITDQSRRVGGKQPKQVLLPPARPLPKGMSFRGDLLMEAVDLAGVVRRAAPKSLFVVRIDNDWHDADEKSRWVKLTLVDERYFTRGIMARHRFNVTLPGPTLRLDKSTVNTNGQLINWGQLAREHVRQGLFRSPRISNIPDSWNRIEKETIFSPLSDGLTALSRMITETGKEDPCLRLDSTVAIHDRGDGFVGFAINGKGPNTEKLPANAKLSEEGKGQGSVAEATYVLDFLVVVGLARIATVAVDDWEPVLVIRGVPQFLSDELVNLMTGGAWSLVELAEFVLLPASEQRVLGFDEEVIQIFREQAWRLWRLPGVQLIGRDVVEDVGVPEGGQRVGKGFYTTEDGPNAHLLPLQPQAEIVNGRRVAVDVQSYGWTTVRSALAVENRLASATRAVGIVAEVIRQLSIANNVIPSPLIAPHEGFSIAPFIQQQSPLNSKFLAEYIQSHRRINRTRELSGASAKSYEAALAAQASARGEEHSILFQLAKSLVAIEAEVEAADAEELGPQEENAKQLIRDADRKIREIRDAERKRTRLSKDPDDVGNVQDETVAVHTWNLPRQGGRGRIFSAELGIVETRDLAGHLAANVAVPSMTTFIPRPVRVLFGVTVRPRIDLPAPPAAPVQTRPSIPRRGFPLEDVLRAAAAGFVLKLREFPVLQRRGAPAERDFGGQNFIPEALTDQESFYTAAFVRVGRGQARQVPLASLPADQIKRVGRRFQELVPIAPRAATGQTFLESIRTENRGFVVGTSNKGDLDFQSEVIASSMFDKPDRVEGRTITLSGPWPVQTDGIIEGVEIRTVFEKQTPAGFTTILSIGSNPPESPRSTRTRVRGAADPATVEALNTP